MLTWLMCFVRLHILFYRYRDVVSQCFRSILATATSTPAVTVTVAGQGKAQVHKSRRFDKKKCILDIATKLIVTSYKFTINILFNSVKHNYVRIIELKLHLFTYRNRT